MSKQMGVARIAFDLWCAEREGETGLALRQQRRLAALVSYARAKSPFYQRLYSALPDENVTLLDLPAVTKPQLMADFNNWITDPLVTRADVDAFVADPALLGSPYRDELFVCTSSGTTGQPGLFLHDQQAISVYRALTVVRVDLAWLAPAQWISFARRGTRWAALLGTGGHFAGAGWMELERRRSAWRSRAYRVLSVQRPLAELVAELNEFDPTILSGYPSALALLADEQIAGRLHLRPILAEIAGESPTADAGARMEAAFGCRIHNAYGASEFPFFAFSCSDGWLHVSSDWAILEPVDEHLRPTPPGEPSHTVLLTNLANRIQPIIRYDLGDSVQWRPDPCPCGFRLPAIRVAGRRDDVLRLDTEDGRTVAVLPLAVGAVVDETPGVRRSQIIQTQATSILLKLDPAPGTDVETLWLDVTANLRAYLTRQGLSNVRVLRAGEGPEPSVRSGKFRQVIAGPRVGKVADTPIR